MKVLTFLISITLGLVAQAQVGLQLQEGHSRFLSDVKYSPDGRYLLTSSWDGYIIVWDMAGGYELHRMHVPDKKAEEFDFIPNTDLIIGGYSYDGFQVWNWKTGMLIKEIPRLDRMSIDDLACRPGTNEIAVVYGSIVFGESKLIIYQYPEMTELYTQEFDSTVLGCLSFSPDGSKLGLGTKASMSAMFGGEVQRVMVMDMSTKAIIHSSEHAVDIGNISFSPDATKIAVSEDKVYGHSADTTNFTVWDIIKGIQLWSLPTKSTHHISFSPDGRMLALAYSDGEGRVELRNSQTYDLIRTFDTKSHGMISFRPDGNRVICSRAAYRLIDEYDVATGIHTRDLAQKTRKVRAISLSPSERYLASVSQSPFDQTIKIWDLQTGSVVKWLKGHKYFPNDVAYSPNGKYLASCSKDKLNVWNTKDWTLLASMDSIKGYCIAWAGSQIFWVGSTDGILHDFSIPKISDGVQRSQQISNDKISDIANLNGAIAIRTEGRIIYSKGSTQTYEVGKSGINVRFLNDSILLADDVYGLNVINITSDTLKKQASYLGQQRSVAIRQSDGAVVIGTGNSLTSMGDIHLWDVEKGKINRVMKHHNTSISSMVFDSKGRLYSGSYDGSIAVWDSTLENVVCTMVANEEEFITSTPKSFYTMSKNGYDFVTFKSGGKVYDVEQFDLIYNRPDEVVKALNPDNKELISVYTKAVANRRRNSSNFSMNNLQDQLPTIEIVDKNNLPFETQEGEIQFRVNVKTHKNSISDIEVWHNGVWLSNRRFSVPSEINKLKEINHQIRVQLVDGNNKIQVGARTPEGIQSLKETYFIRKSGEEMESKIHVLLLSVSEYQNKDYNLKYAVKDGRDIAKTFAANQFKNVESVVIDTFFDEDVNLELMSKLRTKYMHLSAKDQLVVFLSGHGLLDDEGNFYFGSHDVNFANPKARGIPFDQIEQVLKICPAIRKTLLIDACHSGQVDKEFLEEENLEETPVHIVGSFSKGSGSRSSKKISLSNSFYLAQELFLNINSSSGAQVISAAAGDALAYESPEWNNGVFTYAILKGLQNKNADFDENGEISISELREFVIDEVVKETKGRQQPTARSENVQFDWTIWR